MFKIIACINNNFALGKNGDLLYHIKNDLQNFRRITSNNVIIMGRKTFESLPNGALSNRVNIVITTDRNFTSPNCIVVHSIEEAYTYCNENLFNRDWYVIGGSTLYQQFLERGWVDELYLTQVIDNAEGDVYFPNFHDYGKWDLFYKSETQFNQPPFTFSIYKLNKN